jgi:nitrate/nitrite transport system permease protein
MKKLFTIQTYLPILFGIGSAVLLLGAWWGVSILTNNEIPTPLMTWAVFSEMLATPFYDNGPNDKGIGNQLVSSLIRVFSGFGAGSLVAIPVGLLIGSSKTAFRLINPIVQILRPVSPLAWFPLGLLAFKAAEGATIFIIFITSVWPTLINTAFG